MKVALVQDWLVVNAGAEKVFKEMVSYFKDADIFSLVDFLSDEDRLEILNGKHATTSFLQKLPFAQKSYRNFLPLFTRAIESLDFSGYDLIVSSSYAVAKGLKKQPHQIHICYCHSPIRYAWDLQDEYLAEISAWKRALAKPVLAQIRKWDVNTLNSVDVFLANSQYIAERIKRIYNRDSIVLYPPVNTTAFKGVEQKENYYFTSARMVSYKKTDIIIKAFNQLPHLKLVVSGDGPDMEYLKTIAGKNITFTGFLDRADLIAHMQKAKAFILAANEDFGITSIEAQSCYTPVIALKKGGYLETVIPHKTGILFNEQTPESLTEAILEFETKKYTFTPQNFINNVNRFSVQEFINGFDQVVKTYAPKITH
jgi:glycosyltransferase involved in cell wall biosynthesis